MTYEEMDRATGRVKDNPLLQGQPLDRLDRRTAEIAEKIDASASLPKAPRIAPRLWRSPPNGFRGR